MRRIKIPVFLFAIALFAITLPLTALATQDSEESAVRIGSVNASDVRVRTEPSLSAQILTKTNRGDAVAVYGDRISGDGGDWYNISIGTYDGYIAAQFVTITGEDAGAVMGRITGSSVRFRAGPSRDAQIIGGFSKGDYIEIISLENGWYKAMFNSSTGYVSADFVSIYAAGSAETAEVTVSAASSANTELGERIVEYAKQFLGSPYVYGTSNGKTFDCSGFTTYVFKNFGYNLNRSAAGQLSNGTAIDKSSLAAGDLVLFRDTSISTKAASHVGIYIGGGQFIHCSSGKNAKKVIISNLNEGYYNRVYIAARRVI